MANPRRVSIKGRGADIFFGNSTTPAGSAALSPTRPGTGAGPRAVPHPGAAVGGAIHPDGPEASMSASLQACKKASMYACKPAGRRGAQRHIHAYR